ncbi:MAG TPA: biopolymer transporter ExbD [Puia sp.]|jgi:biopolymer transport protein ExbD|nr:biopolymer transporter ExbD [Puia sp.]
MAEINTQAGNPHNRGGRRSKKLSTRVDMTPMVDLGFLLITFFVVTTTWSKAHVTKLNMPADGPTSTIGNNAALTVIPVAGNKLFYYHGEWSEALRKGSYGTTGYGLNGGIGDIIRAKQIAMDHSYKGGRKELMLLIKPSPDASYGNVVSLLDETAINDVKRYALVDLTAEERQDISSKIL